MSSPITLTRESYDRGIAELASKDPSLAHVISTWGPPPFWTHPPGYPGIVLAILAQQVSLESARATFARLEVALGSVEPQGLLSLDDAALKRLGFSRQKAAYARGVAEGILTGTLDLDSVQSMEDTAAREKLMEVRGIGAWTASTYMVLGLRRQDAWPSGDLALAKAIQELEGLATTPSSDEIEQIAERWRPWRSVAARILWHYYLSKRHRTASVPPAWSG